MIKHLQASLASARGEKNKELVSEIEEILDRVERLAARFFRWERSISRSLKAQEIREIKKLPLGL